MDTTDYSFGAQAWIDFLPLERALPTLRRDLSETGPVLLLCYLADPPWIHDLFADHLKHSELQILCDHRQRSTLKPFLKGNKNLHIASWSYNRTMHDKRVLFPALDTVYLTTNNLTHGSWTLSINSTARIKSAKITERLTNEFHAMWQLARPLLP